MTPATAIRRAALLLALGTFCVRQLMAALDRLDAEMCAWANATDDPSGRLWTEHEEEGAA